MTTRGLWDDDDDAAAVPGATAAAPAAPAPADADAATAPRTPRAVGPAGNVLVGTASWTDKTLIACGRFYPKGVTSAEARLRFYASQFPMVEVDSSYYAMPSASTTQLWAERTPPGFVMNVKAFRLFTDHPTSPQVLHRDLQLALGPSTRKTFREPDLPAAIVDELWRRYREALMPLRASGRLGLVHFQFPPWVRANASGEALLRRCVERMEGHLLSIELRHRSWYDGDQAGRTLALLQSLGAVHTVVDGPQGFDNSVPALWEATTASHALLRLHGRNRETWNIKGATAASDRFNYDYRDEELGSLARQAGELARQVGQMHVVFNNNMEDQGQRNARSMIEALRLEGEDWTGG